ncbi:MAG: hypothetical protein PHN82_07500 [bacterium]|nr:hypothetical protein [bacterium]
MEMGSKKAVGEVPRRGEVFACPACGYEDGFHVSFRFGGDGAASVYLICPDCHARFRTGWTAAMG